MRRGVREHEYGQRVFRQHNGEESKRMSNGQALRTKVDSLHTTLNEYYALDPSWRKLGKWPDSVHGSVLHDPASDEEIAAAEARFGHAFPPSYKEFLRLHKAWEHFWGDYTLIGIGAEETRKAQDEIAGLIRDQKEDDLAGDDSPDAVAAWQNEGSRNLYLANHLVIGTNFSGELWVFDTRTRGADQEMQLVFWELSSGLQPEPRFDGFEGLLDYAIHQVNFRLERLKARNS